MHDSLRPFRGLATAVALAASVPFAAFLHACGEGAASTPVSMRLSVKGMHCEGCEGAIRDKVARIDGVASCSASHVEESVEVIAPAERRTEIEEAIRRLGYTIE